MIMPKSLFGSVIRPPDKPQANVKKGMVRDRALEKQGIKSKKTASKTVNLKGKR